MLARKNLPSLPIAPTLRASFSQHRASPRRANQTQGTIPFSPPISRFCRSAIAGLFLGGVIGPAHAAPVIGCDHSPDDQGLIVSDDGTIDLHWSGAGTEFELEQATDASFSDAHVRYRGPDNESVLTGLSDGIYHFRIRDAASEDWSEPLVLHVKSMNRGTLFLLLGTGAFVALSTGAAIIHGFLRSR